MISRTVNQCSINLSKVKIIRILYDFQIHRRTGQMNGPDIRYYKDSFPAIS